MSSAQCFFVGGISGTGKTSLLSRLTVLHPHVTHVVASRLLSEISLAGGRLRPSVVSFEQASAFQVAIVERFLEVRRQVPGPIVLDGHYVVPTVQGPFCLPANVFERMAIDVFILLENAPEVVANRLRVRGDAVWWDGRVESVRDAILLERQHAREVAEGMCRKLVVVDEACAEAENLVWEELSV